MSHISSATEFFVNSADTKQMSIVNQALKKLSENPVVPPAKAIKGRKVRFAAQYDGYYARCRVGNRDNRDRENSDGAGNWFVDFIDFGNRASVSRLALAELPDELRTDNIPPLAMKCVMTGLRCDPKSASYRTAGNMVCNNVI